MQFSHVFSLPMRNWNPVGDEGRCGERHGFQPTYEELKPNRLNRPNQAHAVFSLPMRNWNRFKTFYHFLGYLFSAYLWGIETFDNNNRQEGFYNVFSLPMRNWNPICLKYLHKWLVFSAYLWGIETNCKIFISYHVIRFSAYLWGIETYIVVQGKGM